jgi:allophanate hydrolase subunit 2
VGAVECLKSKRELGEETSQLATGSQPTRSQFTQSAQRHLCERRIAIRFNSERMSQRTSGPDNNYQIRTAAHSSRGARDRVDPCS